MVGLALRTGLLSLPVEIRLLIYELLLTNAEKTIVFDPMPDMKLGSIAPAVLQTCKQIHFEARPVLYSENKFSVNSPKHMLQVIEQIGPANLRYIEQWQFNVPWYGELDLWVHLLDALVDEAGRIRTLGISWDAKFRMTALPGPATQAKGLGDSLLFVRTLAAIQGVEKLILQGYYAKHWPSYLQEASGAAVEVRPGRKELFEKESSTVRFERYQEVTADVVP